MSTATTECPGKRSNGQVWTTGPYVRVALRERWNTVYDEASAELKMLADYPRGVEMDDEQVDVAAFNIACRVTWLEAREDTSESPKGQP